MKSRIHHENQSGLTRYLSPLAAWALAFGCIIGWGSFVLPGTDFLPAAGPVGTVLGLLVGAGLMIVIAVNYYQMMEQHPDAGGAYSFVSRIMGNDHGFLCAWMLILTYIAIIWANATALSLIVRYLFGKVLCFGFSYNVFGYTVYLGEVLASIGLLAVTGVICMLGKRFAASIQIICAVLLFVTVTVCFISVVIHRGGFSELKPAFSSAGNPVVQILGIIMMAPWAYIGFETISHSSDEFKFPVKKSFPIMIAALVCGALTYIMLTLCAGLAVPDGYADWGEYIAALAKLDGAVGLPTFYSAKAAMGDTGLILLGIGALCAIVTILIGYYTALSRLLYKMSQDGVFRLFGKLNRHKIPYKAILLIMGVSCFVPLLGRTAIGWIVDVTTIGALIVYTYVSICAVIHGRRQKKKSTIVWGILGTVISFGLISIVVVPALWESGVLAAESYMIMIIWSLLGMIVFRILISRDMTRNMGKSGIVWVILLVLVLFISFIWIQQNNTSQAEATINSVNAYHSEHSKEAGLSEDNSAVEKTNQYIDDRIEEFNDKTHRNVIVQNALILLSMIIIFSIYSLIKKREKQIEEERMMAEESSRAKTIFLSNMSHDIRTPMNAIMGYTALAKKEKDVPRRVREYLDKIDLSGNQLLELINDVLDMSRIQSGKVELSFEPVNLYSMLDELNDIFSIQMQAKNLNFSIDYSEVYSNYVVCDKTRFNRVMLNLVSNAYKFTPEGGSISVVLKQKEEYNDIVNYELTVSDTGIGMSPEFVNSIFTAFERERTSTVSKEQGTGLGMSIAKSLVEMMGGTIDVETEQGVGTTFTVNVSFPVAPWVDEPASDAFEENESADLPADYSAYRLLVVEDNPINAEIACAILTGEGFRVDTAENGKIALEMVSSAEPGTYDVILMDIQMPVMDGYESARAIRALSDERATVPIIAVTANTFDVDRIAALEAGMNTHIAKPYTPLQLINTICQWLSPKEPSAPTEE